MSSTSTELAPTYDYGKALVTLGSNRNASLRDLLVQVATVPAPTKQKNADLATVERVGEDLMRNIGELPAVFGKVDPKTKRILNKIELAKLLLEKVTIDAVEKAVKKRKARIHEIISDHFDCVAKRKNLVGEDTPTDAKGHYLIATQGSPEEAAIEDSGKYFTRERTKDSANFSYEKLLTAYEAGDISRADYLACTTVQKTRVIDEDKLRAMLLSKARRERGQKLMDKITVYTPGRLSINLRGK